VGHTKRIGAAVAGAGLAGLTAYDLLQSRHAILRNYPVAGHLRYLLESLGPELRQYIVTSNDEERPFSRDQRRWIYASSKREINTFGFGTDNDLEENPSLLVMKQDPFPKAAPRDGTTGSGPEYLLPAPKVLGGARGRRHAFRPQSVVNISGMSYGSLSPRAVEALNRGAAEAPCLQNTGEGGLAPAHGHGGELIFQIGTGYFGCRDRDGRFSLDRLRERIAEHPVRALEIKLSQGAKPGLGGMLPAAKVTKEIAAIRDVPEGEDCVSPARHTAFSDVDSLLEFIEHLADATGLPVGIKSAVGRQEFWDRLAVRMRDTGRGPDFITIDGAEGGTGAAPLAYSDHVSLPFKLAFSRVYCAFAEAGLTDDVVFIGGGRLGLPDSAVFAFALGADMVNVGREAMMAVGCIQAQRCHTGGCPTGVATQSRWLMRGLDPDQKHARCANYVRALRAELLALSRSMGVVHPAQITPEHLEIVSERFATSRVEDIFGYDPAWRVLSRERTQEIEGLVGPPDDVPSPGPEGGPIAGDEAGGDGHGEGTEEQGMAGEGSEAGLAAGGD
jgi:glutamate synthase domain-containing protein 2